MVRAGATLLADFDPEKTTHLLFFRCDKSSVKPASVARQRALEQLNLTISEVPGHIPTLNYKWMSEALSGTFKAGQAYWPDYAVFGSREKVGYDPVLVEERKAREKVAEDLKLRGRRRVVQQ